MPTDYEGYSDADLVQCYQKGAEEAGNTLCQRYWGPLYRFFNTRIRNSEVAKDLVQETFLAALRMLKNGKDRSPRNFRSWCYKIAARILGRWLKDQEKRGRHVSVEDMMEDGSEQVLLAPVADHPEHQIADEELGAIRLCFEGTLRGRELEIFRLRQDGTLTFKEIGEVLGLKTGTVKVRYHRTVIAFRKWLEKHYHENRCRCESLARGCLFAGVSLKSVPHLNVLNATRYYQEAVSRSLHKRNVIMREMVTRKVFFIFLLLSVAHVHAEIAFFSDRDGNSNIYVMNDHGGNIRRITDTPFKKANIAWSPDGTQIAFTTEINSGQKGTPQQYDIFIMNADGTRQRNLTDHPAIDVSPSWSPDGKSIAFTSSRNQSVDIYTIEIATRKVRRLTSNTFSSAPDWSPDGKSIIYARTLIGRGRHIYIMNADGTHERQLPRKLRQPQWGENTTIFSFRPRWSPDGEYVIYIEGILQPDSTRIANHVIVIDKHGRTPQILNISRIWKIDTTCSTDNGNTVLFDAVPNGLANDINIFDIYK